MPYVKHNKETNWVHIIVNVPKQESFVKDISIMHTKLFTEYRSNIDLIERSRFDTKSPNKRVSTFQSRTAILPIPLYFLAIHYVWNLIDVLF